MAGHRKVLMSETDQFWEYAKEAMLLACDAKIASSTTESISTAWRGQCRVVD
jgi:hypothetical protein